MGHKIIALLFVLILQVSGSHDKSLRLWERTQEPLVLEEEREMEREKAAEDAIAHEEQQVVRILSILKGQIFFRNCFDQPTHPKFRFLNIDLLHNILCKLKNKEMPQMMKIYQVKGLQHQ